MSGKKRDVWKEVGCLERRGMSFISVQQRPRRAPVYKCTAGRKSAAGKERDDWIMVYRREGKRCFCRRVQQCRNGMSVLECTAEKERDVFNAGLYTVHIEWERDVTLQVYSREGEGCLN